MLHLDVSFYKILCCTCACLSTRACAAPVRVYLQEPVLHLCMSVYKSFVLHLDMSVYKSLAAPVLVCLHARALCCTAAPGRVCLQEPSQCCTCRCTVYKKNSLVCYGLFQNRYVIFRCFDTCSKQRNKLKQTKEIIFCVVNRETTETDLVSVLFDSS